MRCKSLASISCLLILAFLPAACGPEPTVVVEDTAASTRIANTQIAMSVQATLEAMNGVPGTPEGVRDVVLMETGNPDFAVVGFNSSGEALAVMTDTAPDGSILGVTGAIWRSARGDALVLYFGSDGLPERAIVAGSLVRLSNYTDATVDVEVISPGGGRVVERGVQIDPEKLRILRSMRTVSSGGIQPAAYRPSGKLLPQDAFKLGSIGLTAFSCGMTLFFAGPLAAVAAPACVSSLLIIAAANNPDTYAFFNQANAELGKVSCTQFLATRSSVLDCGAAFLDAMSAIFAAAHGTEQELAGSTPTPARVGPTKTRPTPTKTVPTPTKIVPTPTKTRPTPTKTRPTPTKIVPTPTKTRPTPTKTRPTPTKIVPTPTKSAHPTKTRPTPTKTVPTPTKTRPTPTKTRPTATHPVAPIPALNLSILGLTQDEITALAPCHNDPITYQYAGPDFPEVQPWIEGGALPPQTRQVAIWSLGEWYKSDTAQNDEMILMEVAIELADAAAAHAYLREWDDQNPFFQGIGGNLDGVNPDAPREELAPRPVGDEARAFHAGDMAGEIVFRVNSVVVLISIGGDARSRCSLGTGIDTLDALATLVAAKFPGGQAPTTPSRTPTPTSAASTSILYQDDFSSDAGWQNHTSGNFALDKSAGRVAWHVDRSSSDYFYHPIDAPGRFVRIRARVQATHWDNNCDFYFGLAEDLNEPFPHGAFVDVGWFGEGVGSRMLARANIGDIYDPIPWSSQDPSSYISYQENRWYWVTMEIGLDEVFLDVEDENHNPVGSLSGSLPDAFGRFHYILLFGPNNGDWPTGDGYLDDLTVEVME